MPRSKKRTLLVDGLKIHVREIPGDEPAILLINGLGANTGVWSTMERTLEGRRLLEFDAPGVGRSTMPRTPVSVPRLARIATAVLDDAGVDRADVLGYSMGGIVAQRLAASAPERVRRLVLVATTVGVGGFSGDAVSLLNIAAPIRYLSPKMYAKSLGGLTGGRARHDREWTYALSRERLDLAPKLRGYMSQLMSLATWSSLPLLHRIEHPTLVIGGDDDPLSPVANGMLLAHRIPRARLIVARGEGHLMPVDPDSVIHDPVRGFLNAKRAESSAAWKAGVDVDAATLEQAIAATKQSQPMGAIGALARSRLLPAAA